MEEPRSPGTRAALERDVETLVRMMTVESQKLGQVFAERHRLHPTDFEALIHVMEADQRGNPLTPGDLSASLNLSSGATSAVIDRLERQDFVRRDRDDVDRRRVHLRYADRGARLAFQFFGGLNEVFTGVTDQFSDAELEVVRRFMAGIGDGVADYRRGVESTQPHGA